MFSISVAIYLFLAGAGGGLACATFCLDEIALCYGSRRPRRCKRMKALILPGLLTSLILVALGTVFLVADLGRPERAFNTFLYPGLNFMSFGVFSIAAFLLVQACQILTRIARHPVMPAVLYSALRWLGALSALAVLSYAGFLLWSWGSGVPFWDSPFLPALCILSSLSSGYAIVRILDVATERHLCTRVLPDAPAVPEALLPVAEALVMSCYLVSMWYDSGATSSLVIRLLTGELVVVFWGGIVAAGLCVPVALGALLQKLPLRRIIVLRSAVLLMGALMLRIGILFGAFA